MTNTHRTARYGHQRRTDSHPPSEVPEENIRKTLAQFGDIKTIKEKTWSKAYPYAVSNGVKLMTIALQKYIPSHEMIEGHGVLISHEEQPISCYGCNATIHMYQVCPVRQEKSNVPRNGDANTWVQVTAHGSLQPEKDENKRVEVLLPTTANYGPENTD